MSPGALDWKEVQAVAEQEGASLYGASKLSSLSSEAERLSGWQKQGFAAGMQYMMRPPELFVSLQNFLPSARSIVSFAFCCDERGLERRPHGSGRIARYAWGKDYHRPIKQILRSIHKKVEHLTGQNIEARVFVDAVPLLERAFASRAGLGFIGKNTMLLRPGEGSFFMLGEIIWDVDLENVPSLGVEGSCGTCARCQTGCPTNAFPEPRVLDANLCISYLTIEHRGSFTVSQREALDDWIFGCDICQEVCPFNYRGLKKGAAPRLGFLAREAGVGPYLSLEEVLGIRSDEDFKARFLSTALMRPKREGLLRNAAVVAGNTVDESSFPVLLSCITEDSSALVRQHALWAAKKIAEACGNKALQDFERVAERARRDKSPLVNAELSALYEQER